jgi:hypothetical protein
MARDNILSCADAQSATNRQGEARGSGFHCSPG